MPAMDNDANGSTPPIVTIAEGRATIRLNRPRQHNRIEPDDLTDAAWAMRLASVEPTLQELIKHAREIAQLLLRSGGALEVADAGGLAGAVRRLLSDPAERQRVGASGRRVIDANRAAGIRPARHAIQSRRRQKSRTQFGRH